MTGLERRLDRPEGKINPSSWEGWCCATEADAIELIARLRSEGSPPPLLFIAGQPNSDGTSCWPIEGKTVAGPWRQIDRFAPEPPRVELVSQGLVSKAGEHLSDEQLLGVIAQAGATLVMHRDGNSRLLEAREQL
jgi:hypothetical protein